MIKPNWAIFKAKFYDNPQKNFEWLCYLLFCKEFHQRLGIFRFKNQAAIETDPIEVEGEVKGWQAKFYETCLSEHKKDFLESIKKAKEYYPKITEIIFYTNQEWGQYKGKDPKCKIEVEEQAKLRDIKLVWKGPSFFESSFVSIEDEIIVKYFFTNDKSIFDLIQEQERYTENILEQVKTSFNFRDQKFEIDRSGIIEEIENSESPVIILSGSAGVGKTAVVKRYYKLKKNQVPFYVFRATEFSNLRNLNEFFKDFSFYEFINAHKDDKEKIIVIDSAEKLLDLKNKDPFKEFLQIICKSQWKIIFTSRDNYVDVLYREFLEIYGIIPKYIDLLDLTEVELSSLSDKYNFNLPSNKKLQELIRNPFYLNKYLNFYDENEELEYIGFKKKLWNQMIYQSKPNNEQCFLKIAFDLADTGKFFISPNCEPSTLTELVNSGILGYESPYGYFIVHDIYGEWALEKKIEREFTNKRSIEEFFQNIGISLPIRRSFRNWLLEKPLLDDFSIKQLIENTFNSDIDQFWKDEILTSVLLSEYSERFFNRFKDELLSNQELVKRIAFLLITACKEVDNDFLKQLQLGLQTIDLSSLGGELTKPKGYGWKSFIKFIFDNFDNIKVKSIEEDISFVLPVICEWNTKFKEGETTRFSSLIALKYYRRIIDKNKYSYNGDTKNKLLLTILYGVSEIKKELKGIFKEVLNNSYKDPSRNPYYDLVKIILVPKVKNEFKVVELVAKALPSCVLKLAAWFWSYTPRENNISFYSRNLEQCFGLEESRDYYPASAYQTPIYWLLKFSYQETVDFILKFINKSVNYYVDSGFSNSVRKIKLYFDDGTTNEQYVDERLWNMYRGGIGSPVCPYLLRSIHMALEKYLLEIAKDVDTKEVERLLLYLLRNSESASISAVVTSIVLAYPDKTFNVAKILFKTDEFIIQDEKRLSREDNIKSLYSMSFIKLIYGINNSLHKFYEDERIETCGDKHRKWDLKSLSKVYQTLKNQDISGEEIKKRQEELLADYEIKNNEKYKEFKQYEEDPKRALDEAKEIVKELKKINPCESFSPKYAILAERCSALIKHHISELSEDDRLFCKELAIEFVSSLLESDYQFQFPSGVEYYIMYVLPILLKEFPEEKVKIKSSILCLLLIDQFVFGNVLVNSVKELFENSFEDAQSLLLGYLKLKPKYEALRERNKIKENIYRFKENELMKLFIKKYEVDLMKVVNNSISIEPDDLVAIENLDLFSLERSFQLIPEKTNDEPHKKIAKKIIDVFAHKILLNSDSEIDSRIADEFLQKYAYFILNLPEKEICDYLQPFIKEFKPSEIIAVLFEEIICAEDTLNTYNKFWIVWKSFKEKVFEIGKNDKRYGHTDKIIKSFLFATVSWKEGVKEWHTLKDNNAEFFKEVSKRIGHCPSALYAISKLLNDFGSPYIDEGIGWISDIIKSNEDLVKKELEPNTIYYIESLVRKYVYYNLENIKKRSDLKSMILIILNFLVEKASETGYRIREDIL